MVKIAVIDDSLLWQQAIKRKLEIFLPKDYECIVTVTDGLAFLLYCSKTKLLPDIALMDIDMPRMDGVSLTDFLTDNYPGIKVIALSCYSDDKIVEDMFAGGAWAFVCKVGNMPFLEDAIKCVSSNEIFIDPRIAFDISLRTKLMQLRKVDKNTLCGLSLTYKEKILLSLNASEASVKEMAEILCISDKTIEKHIQNISQKMSVSSRKSLAIIAIRKGLVRIAHLFSLKEL